MCLWIYRYGYTPGIWNIGYAMQAIQEKYSDLLLYMACVVMDGPCVHTYIQPWYVCILRFKVCRFELLDSCR